MTIVAKMCESKGFLIFATGTIESASYPLGPESSQVFCRFEIIAGSNWELVSGVNSGISQAAMRKNANDKIVFNIPFECVYRSSNPFGWPQILVSIYGKNRLSVETTLGYCLAHLPIIGSETEKIIQPIRVPKDTSVMGELLSWITSKNAELKNPKMMLDGYGNNELLSMEKSGELKFSLRTLCRRTKDVNYQPNEKFHKAIKKI